MRLALLVQMLLLAVTIPNAEAVTLDCPTPYTLYVNGKYKATLACDGGSESIDLPPGTHLLKAAPKDNRLSFSEKWVEISTGNEHVFFDFSSVGMRSGSADLLILVAIDQFTSSQMLALAPNNSVGGPSGCESFFGRPYRELQTRQFTDVDFRRGFEVKAAGRSASFHRTKHRAGYQTRTLDGREYKELWLKDIPLGTVNLSVVSNAGFVSQAKGPRRQYFHCLARNTWSTTLDVQIRSDQPNTVVVDNLRAVPGSSGGITFSAQQR